MEASFRPFVRFIHEKQMQLLEETAKSPKGSWLCDALGDPELFFALRDERIDVYYRGRAIYSIEFSGGKVTPRTHVKYLVLDDRDPYIKMQNASFDYKHPYLQGDYQERVSLRQMKAAAKTFSGIESMGVYAAIKDDPFVIDVEVAFNRSTEVTEHDELEVGRKQDRVDVVRLRRAADGFDLVFWEAKHFSNSELFNDKILRQLAAYERQLQAREEQLLTAFRNVCRFHHDLDQLRKSLGFDGGSESHLKTLQDLASGKLALNVVKEPSLFVFGFDNDQKGGRWKGRKEHFEGVLGKERLRAIGDASDGFEPGGKKKGVR
ncbi:hypothetical protein FHT80_002169 [Rhizobium sp. BK226]|uniref:hypothetical protein n=1 Tax=Rhizobium TaxID=379 RepID=UPI001618E2F8|nr:MULTISPECIES: hypothetical protein [Rhizobium]MBB3300939.1 hypothetical protein [Rhizobium sp. BK112]MBB3368562.1 hypothetical protein [Rhizobium sp. BK077]MBB4112847.1 hypothetical protein [Rhizobium sp. BK226]MBB4180829.1 hypothetical protein [Rhizobium sp. BK109]UTS89513.1 hypothetical protein NE851_23240 [Rhizobium anhuiense bv. trifolii]